MTRLTLTLLIGAAILPGCGRFGDSRFNPFARFEPSVPQSLAPEGGYDQGADLRPGVPQILGASWQPLAEGRLLVVQGFAPLKGYRRAALVTVRPQPGDRLSPDADGVLRLRFVALPPAQQTLAADPATDTITVALPLSTLQLGRIRAVEIAGAAGAVTLPR